jgi:hypothetical protein
MLFGVCAALSKSDYGRLLLTALCQDSLGGGRALVGAVGLEPTLAGLKVRCLAI